MRKKSMAFCAILAVAFVCTAPAQDMPQGNLEKKAEELAAQLDSKYFYDRENARKELMEIGLPAENALINVIKTGSSRSKLSACGILGEIKSAKAVIPLLELYSAKDSDETLKKSIVKTLKIMADEIVRIMDDPKINPKPILPKDIQQNLLSLKVEKALSDLITEDNDYGHYDGQFDALRKFDAGIIPVLVDMFSSEGYDFFTTADEERAALLRTAAGDALGVVGDMSAAAALVPVFDNYWDIFLSQGYSGAMALNLAETAAVSCYMIGEKGPVETMTEYFQEELNNMSTDNVTLEEATINAYNAAPLYAGFLLRLDMTDKAVDVYNYIITVHGKLQKTIEDQGRRDVRLTQPLTPYYNLACIYSLGGDKKKALEYLTMAVDKGYKNHLWMQKDKDLDNLRDTEEFKALMKKLESAQKKQEENTGEEIY